MQIKTCYQLYQELATILIHNLLEVTKTTLVELEVEELVLDKRQTFKEVE